MNSSRGIRGVRGGGGWARAFSGGGKDDIKAGFTEQQPTRRDQRSGTQRGSVPYPVGQAEEAATGRVRVDTAGCEGAGRELPHPAKNK